MKPPKPCRRCGRPVDQSKHWYCYECRLAARRSGVRTHERSSTQRGYGAEHQRLRKVWAAKVAAGNVRCWRCGKPIGPGEPWDLGHDDSDRRVYRGPEHREENRATAGRREPVRQWPW